MITARKVLVVDDDADVLAALGDELRQRFVVDAFQDPRAALDRMRTEKYDAVVSDVRMPVMNGVEFVERASAMDDSLVRVFLTGYSDEDVLERARDSGAFKLKKPWGDELELILDNAISHRRQMQGLRAELEELVRPSSPGSLAVPRGVDIDEVVDQLTTSLKSFPWVLHFDVQELETERPSERAGRSDAWTRAQLPPGIGVVERRFRIGSAKVAHFWVRVRWLAAHPYASSMVELVVQQADDGLRMRELTDVLRQRTSQLDRAKLELLERDRLATYGTLASALIHDVRSPLSVLAANSAYLTDRIVELGRLDPELLSALDDQRTAIQHIQGSLDALKVAAVPEEDATSLVARALEQVERIMRVRLNRAGIQLKVQWLCDVPIVRARMSDVVQMLLTLVSNAVEASSPGSMVFVRVRSGQTVVTVEVEDEGSGVSSELTETIFNPFFSTKENSMGIGLSVCRHLAKRYGGDVRLDTAQALGALFELSLPRG